MSRQMRGQLQINPMQQEMTNQSNVNEEMDTLNDFLHAASEGEPSTCTVPIDTLVNLHQQAAKQSRLEPIPAPPRLRSLVTKLSMAMVTCERQSVRVRLSARLTLLNKAWSAVALLPSTAAVVSYTCNASSGVQLLDVHRGKHALISRGFVGECTVQVDAYVAYANKSCTGFDIEYIPECSETTLQMAVRSARGLEVSVDPQLSMAGADEVDMSAFGEGDDQPDASKDTLVWARVRPSQKVNVRWTEKASKGKQAAAVPAAATSLLDSVEGGSDDEDASTSVAAPEPEEAKPPLSLAIEHQHLFSVGEGMLLIESRFRYDIRNGAINILEVSLDPRLRVLSVNTSLLKRWDVTHSTPVRADGSGPAGASVDEDPVLRVLLEETVEGTHELQVSSEIDLGATSVDFTGPVFSHTHPAVTREKGYIAVEARTNVELNQRERVVGCVPLDVAELPDELRQSAVNPLLLAYKFLVPDFTLDLSVKKHGDVDVLIAVADSAHFVTTKTLEGKTMYQMILLVRNTQRQFARVFLPSDAEVWSTVVNAKAVKPALDDTTGAVMVPLVKSSRGRSAPFNVEMIWVMGEESRLPQRGRLNFSFPRVDMPLNKVFVSVYLPLGFRYGEFDTTDLREITQREFRHLRAPEPSNTPVAVDGDELPHGDRNSIDSCSDDSEEDMMELVCAGLDMTTNMGLAAPPSMKKKKKGGFGGGGGARNARMMQSNAIVQQQQQQPSRGMKQKSRPTPRGMTTKAVVPVRVEMVRVGKKFLLKRLLVVDEALSVSVPFAKRSDKKGKFGVC